ncbi:hypothetical protein GCM10023084_29270 [Streptomyces lacrimifluminis]|uniref:Uncharacterized protein n=1 Tax=Streptomyces lacrimifluminis TaxID=1500077 RepID=A0A917NTW7_9ACTN|nr:hypothetical protein GCM10012282_25900 [Streptomyces lacrimifluminis]
MRQHGGAFDSMPARSPAGNAALTVDQYEVFGLRRNEIREPANGTVGLPERALKRPAQLPLTPEVDFPPSLGELLGDVPLMRVTYCFPLLKARHGCSVARGTEQVTHRGLNPASPIQSQ